MGMERGTIGRIPFLATGSGPPMVFAGGLSFSAGVEAPGTEKMAASMVKPFAERRRVLFVNRRRAMPRGMTMAEIAAEHADGIRALGAGPVDVAAISTGGSIVQQMAADHPDVVGRLLLLSTACRLGPDGKRLQRRIAARARRGALRQAIALSMTGLVPPGRGQTPAAAVAWLAGPRVLAGGDDLTDMATTIEAEDAFDLASCASPIRAPTDPRRERGPLVQPRPVRRDRAPDPRQPPARVRGPRAPVGRPGPGLQAGARALRRGGCG